MTDGAATTLSKHSNDDDADDDDDDHDDDNQIFATKQSATVVGRNRKSNNSLYDLRPARTTLTKRRQTRAKAVLAKCTFWAKQYII